MARSVGRLAPDRMSTDALFDFVLDRLSWLRWESGYSVKECDAAIKQLYAAVYELQDRVKQLHLPF